MFRFAQHDKSKKLGIELYENLTLQRLVIVYSAKSKPEA